VYGRYATAGQVMTNKSQNTEREELNTCLLGMVASNNVFVIAGAAIVAIDYASIGRSGEGGWASWDACYYDAADEALVCNWKMLR